MECKILNEMTGDYWSVCVAGGKEVGHSMTKESFWWILEKVREEKLVIEQALENIRKDQRQPWKGNKPLIETEGEKETMEPAEVCLVFQCPVCSVSR